MIASFLFWIIKDCLFLLGYISGRQSFHKPLSPYEEREALARMREGDESARQMLIEHNMRLIVHIARKYKVPGCTFDDLISIGAIGLIKAVRSYDPDAGTSLSTYAARCIENAMLSQERFLVRRKGALREWYRMGSVCTGFERQLADVPGGGWQCTVCADMRLQFSADCAEEVGGGAGAKLEAVWI